MNSLSIDLGTQSVRSAIVSKNGEVLSVFQIAQEVDSPYPGWAQQSPRFWWDLTKKAIKNVIKQSKIDITTIKAISTCGQMHGPVGIDKEGRITTEWTQIWCDKRGDKICRLIKDNFDESELANITGNPITTGWPGVKVRWIKENQEDIYDKTDVFLVPKDFINYQLTGVAVTDPSEASGTYLYDINTNDYSKHMSEIMELDLSKFAPIKQSYDIIGNIKDAVANELNIPLNTPVIAGGGDFIVSLLGIGLTGKGTAIDMTGTSTLFVVHRDEPIIDPSIQNLKHVLDGWLPFSILDTGGLAMKWCRDFINSLQNMKISYEQMINMARNCPIGSEGLLFYPYLLGERQQNNAEARASFYGITLNHKAEHFARAVLEGVALAIGKDVQNFRKLGVNIGKVYCVGGATRNKLLYEIKANITNTPQLLTDEPEASLRGCGLLASYGLGLIKDIEQVVEENRAERIEIKPVKESVLKYEKILEDFKKMYQHLFGYWM